MKKFFLIPIIFIAVLLINCASKESKARSLLETARFEEQQHNHKRADQLYNELKEKYPGTRASEEAKNRIKHVH
ncbi:MAG: hypothetical protein ABIA63_08085 [bacterium]